MIRWKHNVTAAALSLLLAAVPAGAALAASAVQTLLYGAAAMTLAKRQLMQMDDGSRQQMLASTKKKTGVSANEAYSRRLEQIQRDIVATGMIARDYDVYVNPSDELNAFETIGGVISVNQGMMKALDDDELAFTLCHEMQHGEKRHAVNGVLKSIGIATLVDVSFGGNADMLDILLGSIAVNYIDNEVITMDQEKEADAAGFAVLQQTAYNVGGALSSMQFVYETYGELYQEGLGRVLKPNNHPRMSQRIEKLSARMAQWSGNRVQVGGDTVYVNALPVIQPAASGAYSPRRRAFLIAGNLARLTHDIYGAAPKENRLQTQTISGEPPQWQVETAGAQILVNGRRIMTCAAGDDGAAIAGALQTAFQAKPAMIPEKEIKKSNAAWKKQYEEKKQHEPETT